MRTSIATVCLSGTLEEKLYAAARAGTARGRANRPAVSSAPILCFMCMSIHLPVSSSVSAYALFYTRSARPARRHRMAAVSARVMWELPLKLPFWSPWVMPARYHRYTTPP